MAYVDNLQKVKIETVNGVVECVGCSYNGVPFFVEEDESSGGRTVVSTVLPKTNRHVNEDAGGQVKQFTFRIYLVGENAEAMRSDLEEAFDAEGPFELVHMYYGRFKARSTTYSFAHVASELNYVSGSVTFVPEEDPKKVARSSEDVHGLADSKANSSLSRAAAMFNEAFSIAGKAANVVQSAVDATNDILDMIEDVRNGMRDVQDFVLNLSQLRENISLIMRTPGDFSNRIQNLFTMTKETFSGDDDWNSYTNESLVMMSKIDVDDGSTTSALMRSQIQRLSLVSAAGMAVKSVLSSKFDNSEQVYETEESLNTAFEAAMAKVTDVNDYMSLADMLAIALKYLREAKSKLAVVLEMPLNDISNALVACYDCYGDLNRVDEIIDRNEIADPSAIDRRSLKVLSN